jgi:hypothetical protein
VITPAITNPAPMGDRLAGRLRYVPDAILVVIACWAGLSIVLGALIGHGLKRMLSEVNEIRAGGQRHALARTLPPAGSHEATRRR